MKSKYTHAPIVPLIGGLPLSMEKSFGTSPEYILSYTPFENNDSQYRKYHNDKIKYYQIDKDIPSDIKGVDVVNATCPCAGLSSLNVSASVDSNSNDWMIESTKFVLDKIKPKVLWGENAPRLATKMGKPIVTKLRSIAKEHGYSMTLYKTKSKLHGLSQVRNRSFYFFWKGDKVPKMNFYNREHEKIEDTIRSVKLRKDDPMNVLVNESKPSENPYYKYVLEEIEGGITHKEFQRKIDKSINPLDYIEKYTNKDYYEVAKWMQSHNYSKEAKRCITMADKLKNGGNIMRRGVEIPKDYIGAFVGHLPSSLTHPDEDRYLTIRECLSIMKMPDNFQLNGGKRNLNMICQNVPVSTGEDMSNTILSWLNGELDEHDAQFSIYDNHTQTFTLEKNI